MNIYQVDSKGYWTGVAREVDASAACPLGWVRDEPPTLKENEFAVWSGRWSVANTSPSPDWAALIAARRYAAEISGTTVEGMPIATDRDSNSLLTGAALAASLDASYSVQWKTGDGFVTLTSAQILGLASAVRAHVQACFDREAELLDAVADGSITAEMMEEGWPA